MLLRDRAKIDEALRALGYTFGEGEAETPAVPSAQGVDGTYTLTEIGTAPPLVAPPKEPLVLAPKEDTMTDAAISEDETKTMGERWQDGTGTVVVKEVPPIGTNVPSDQEFTVEIGRAHV